MCLEKILNKKAKVVIVAEDASDNTKQKFSRICEENKIKIYIFGSKADLSYCIGKNNKTVLAVLDNNFAKSINDMLKDLKGAIN